MEMVVLHILVFDALGLPSWTVKMTKDLKAGIICGEGGGTSEVACEHCISGGKISIGR